MAEFVVPDRERKLVAKWHVSCGQRSLNSRERRSHSTITSCTPIFFHLKITTIKMEFKQNVYTYLAVVVSLSFDAVIKKGCILTVSNIG